MQVDRTPGSVAADYLASSGRASGQSKYFTEGYKLVDSDRERVAIARGIVAFRAYLDGVPLRTLAEAEGKGKDALAMQLRRVLRTTSDPTSPRNAKRPRDLHAAAARKRQTSSCLDEIEAALASGESLYSPSESHKVVSAADGREVVEALLDQAELTSYPEENRLIIHLLFGAAMWITEIAGLKRCQMIAADGALVDKVIVLREGARIGRAVYVTNERVRDCLAGFLQASVGRKDAGEYLIALEETADHQHDLARRALTIRRRLSTITAATGHGRMGLMRYAQRHIVTRVLESGASERAAWAMVSGAKTGKATGRLKRLLGEREAARVMDAGLRNAMKCLL